MKAWTAIDRLSIIWKSNLANKIKCNFSQAAVVLILLYRYSTWTLIKRIEKNLDENYARMIRIILKKFWKQHPMEQQLYGQLPPISKTIQVRWTRHASLCWRSKDVLQWSSTHERVSVDWPARTYLYQLNANIGCNLKDLNIFTWYRRVGTDGEKERVRKSVLSAWHNDDD